MFNRKERHHDTARDADRRDVGRDAGHRDADRGGRHHDGTAAATPAEIQRERFGGTSIAGAFFGWLVAIGVVIILAGIIGAVATAVGASQDITPTSAEGREGTVGIVAAAVLLLVLAIGYFCGGYVAGRMARFNGVRQGVGVWVLGLLVTIVTAVLGAVFGSEYDVLSRVDVPEIPIPTDDLTTGGVIALVATVVVTLLAAILGGKAGTGFHRKVDRSVL